MNTVRDERTQDGQGDERLQNGLLEAGKEKAAREAAEREKKLEVMKGRY